jgi:hypothetical protein
MKPACLVMIAAAMALSACASPPQHIKATASDGRTCTAADRDRLGDLYATQSHTATQDALGVFWLGIPLGGEDHAPEIARLKGRCGDMVRKKA